VSVKTGISDGSTTAIVEGELHEGDLVIVDATTTGGAPASSAPGGPPGGVRRLF